MKGKRWLIILLAGMAFLVYAFIAIRAGRKKSAAGVEVEIAKAKRGELVTTVSGSGLVQAEDKTEVRAEISGILEEVLVEEGARVAKGALLFRFAGRELGKAVKNAESAVETARVQWNNIRIRVDESRLQVSQAEQALAKARLALADAEKSYERIKRLFEKGAVAKEQLEAASSALEGAKLQVAQAENAHQQAIVSAKAVEGEEELAALRLRDAEGNLAELRQDLARTMVRAPRDGIVLSCPAKAGMSVPAGAELCTIGTTRRLVVELPVDEVDIAQLKKGQKATITHEGLPGVKIPGEVSAIPPQAVERGGERVFPVEIAIDNTEGLLHPGMSVDTEIVTNHLTGVLTVPLLAILEEENAEGEIERFIFLVREGKAVKTRVIIGASNESEAEIREGLAEGDAYVSGDYETILRLKDGSSVREKKRAKDQRPRA
ncbi:MAG: efflux RND transporter periplasmic adaptor subunit [Firmicutes bacterium]|nr:efflux RND transporter periplasmic adaptor subunit [Bacillota bacterium]